MLLSVTPPIFSVGAPSAMLSMPTAPPQKPTTQNTNMTLLRTFPSLNSF